MRTASLVFAMCMAFSASAQLAKTDSVHVDLRLAGEHLETAGKYRNTGTLIALGLGGVGLLMASMEGGERPGYAMAAVGGFVGLVFHISANGREIKAGRALKATR